MRPVKRKSKFSMRIKHETKEDVLKRFIKMYDLHWTKKFATNEPVVKCVCGTIKIPRILNRASDRCLGILQKLKVIKYHTTEKQTVAMLLDPITNKTVSVVLRKKLDKEFRYRKVHDNEITNWVKNGVIIFEKDFGFDFYIKVPKERLTTLAKYDQNETTKDKLEAFCPCCKISQEIADRRLGMTLKYKFLDYVWRRKNNVIFRRGQWAMKLK